MYASSFLKHYSNRFYSTVSRVFLKCFRDPILVPRIKIGSLKYRENYRQVPKIREHRVPIESRNRVPTNPYRVPNIFLKKTLLYLKISELHPFTAKSQTLRSCQSIYFAKLVDTHHQLLLKISALTMRTVT